MPGKHKATVENKRSQLTPDYIIAIQGNKTQQREPTTALAWLLLWGHDRHGAVWESDARRSACGAVWAFYPDEGAEVCGRRV